jgi:argininosuccinate lyase
VVKAKASFAHGMVASLLSVGRGLFMGYNRETQWTKYWIMDLVEESKPTVSVMTEVVRLLRVNQGQMLKEAQRDFIGATPLMEWMVHSRHLPLRKAKEVVERAVKYSEKEGLGEVSCRGLKKALLEMEIDIAIREQDVRRIQNPEGILTQMGSTGSPSESRVKENLVSLRARLDAMKDWVRLQERTIEKAKRTLSAMERDLGK